MSEQRDNGGVRIRVDGKGDGWAKVHRDQLGATFNMNDVDGLIGMVAFAANTGDRLFMEYVPDNYANRLNTVRSFATVALFDRKTSREYALGESNRVALAWYLDLCRRLGQTQQKPPKFFLVIGRDAPPWQMVELNTNNGEVVSEHTLSASNWREVWEQVGLAALRNELRRWIDPPRRQEGIANGADS